MHLLINEQSHMAYDLKDCSGSQSHTIQDTGLDFYVPFFFTSVVFSGCICVYVCVFNCTVLSWCQYGV